MVERFEEPHRHLAGFYLVAPEVGRPILPFQLDAPVGMMHPGQEGSDGDATNVRLLLQLPNHLPVGLPQPGLPLLLGDGVRAAAIGNHQVDGQVLVHRDAADRRGLPTI